VSEDSSDPTPAPRPRDGELPLPPWDWRQCLAGVGAVIAAFLLLGLALAIIVSGTGTATDSVNGLVLSLLLTLLFEAALFGVALSFSVGRFPGGLGLLGYRWRPPGRWAGWTFAAWVLAYVALFGYIGLTQIPGLHWLYPQDNVPQGIFEHAATIPLATLLTVIAAPIVEETFFRGFIFNGLRRRLGFSGAASLSGLLFALAHQQGTLIIPFTVIGVILAWTYYRAGTLWANIGAHCLFNLVSVVIAFAGK